MFKQKSKFGKHEISDYQSFPSRFQNISIELKFCTSYQSYFQRTTLLRLKNLISPFVCRRPRKILSCFKTHRKSTTNGDERFFRLQIIEWDQNANHSFGKNMFSIMITCHIFTDHLRKFLDSDKFTSHLHSFLWRRYEIIIQKQTLFFLFKFPENSRIRTKKNNSKKLKAFTLLSYDTHVEYLPARKSRHYHQKFPVCQNTEACEGCRLWWDPCRWLTRVCQWPRALESTVRLAIRGGHYHKQEWRQEWMHSLPGPRANTRVVGLTPLELDILQKLYCLRKWD